VSGQNDLHVYSDLDSPTSNFERLSLSVDALGDATIATSSGGTGDDGDLILAPASGKRVLIGSEGLTVPAYKSLNFGSATYSITGYSSTAFQLKSWGLPFKFLGGAGTVLYVGTQAASGNVGIGTESPSATLDVNGDARFRARIIRSKSVYVGTDTTDDVALHVCDSATAFTLTVTDGADDGEEIKVVNRGAGTVTLSGKINTTTAVTSLTSGETIVLNWDATDDEWQ